MNEEAPRLNIFWVYPIFSLFPLLCDAFYLVVEPSDFKPLPCSCCVVHSRSCLSHHFIDEASTHRIYSTTSCFLTEYHVKNT